METHTTTCRFAGSLESFALGRSLLSGIECLSLLALLVKVAVDGPVAFSLKGLFSNELEFVLLCSGVCSFVGKLSIIILVFRRRSNVPRALLLRRIWVFVFCVVSSGGALVIGIMYSISTM